MKKLWIAVLASFCFVAQAQNDQNLQSPIPVDEDVTIGKLSNGLTYYIKKNSKPENKVELRLVVNAGSILETDEQRGLAHFMEHMNFNGTKNFQHNELVDYLQSIGVKFGQHLNAYTSFDETVYILPIPSDDEEKLEKGFDILEDWAFNCLLTPEEIEKERGVVLEELRLGLGAQQRMMKEYLPMVMYNSQYAKRLPIGTKEVLENFDHKVLQDFYKSWYRPDLMAVVAVGDVDVQEIERKIKMHFGDYKNPSPEKERTEFFVPDHKETFVSIQTDKEAPYNQVQLLYKEHGNARAEKTLGDYRQHLMVSLFNTMINNRLSEIANGNNPPFMMGQSYYGSSWSRNKNSYNSFSISSAQDQLRAFKTLVEENERVQRHGFLESELTRAKSDVLSFYKEMYENRNTTESRSLAGEYVRNFLEDEYIPGIEWEYKNSEALLNNISVEEINSLISNYIHDDNRMVIFTGPEDADAPEFTEADVLKIFEEVEKSEIAAYAETEIAESIMTKMPAAGSISNKEKNEKLGVTKLTLSNGATVFYKKTDFSDNEILMRAISLGGTSLLENDAYKSTHLALGGLSEAGLNGFNKTEMNKMMAGKNVSVYPYVSSNYESLRGNAVNEDLETMFQLIYLNFMSLNNDEEAYNSYVKRQTALLANLTKSPDYWYINERFKTIYKNNPRYTSPFPSVEEFEGQDYGAAYEFYNERYADASDFAFFFVGSFEEKELEEFAQKYIASLPVVDRDETFVNHPFKRLEGEQEFVFNKGSEPKSKVDIYYVTEADYSAKDAYYLKCAAEALTIKLVENLREGESGVYGVGARASASKWPEGIYTFTISFPCGPENVEKLKEAALAEVEKLLKNGPTEKDLNKVKEAQKLELKENLKENNYWMSSLFDMYYYQQDFNKMLETEQKIDSLTAKDIQKAAQKYIGKNRIITILMPEEN